MQIGGIASGIDTQQVIRDLMRAERMPLERMFQQREWANLQRDAYRETNTKLTDFRNSIQDLRLQGTFNAYEATSSNTSATTASATGSAVAGTYDVTVNQLAEVAQMFSANTITDNGGNNVDSSTKVLDAAGLGTDQNFTLENGDGIQTTITVTADDTFGSLANKISQAKDAGGDSLGFKASFDNATGKFLISTNKMGADQEIHLAGVDAASNDFVDEYMMGNAPGTGGSYSASGQYGEVVMEGTTVGELTTNSVTTYGINLKLHAQGASTITVSTDSEGVFEQVTEFVESYNELIADLEEKLREPKFRDFPPLTEEQRSEMSDREIELWEEKSNSGMLRNDTLVQNVLTDMRQSLYSSVESIAGGEISNLSEIGITTGEYTYGGTLFVDEDKLRAAITENPDEVKNLFTASPDDGVADNDLHAHTGLGRRIYDDLNNTIDRLRDRAGNPGVLSADQSVLGKRIDRFDDRIVQFEKRLQQVEQRYWRQFTAMEKAMQEMNNQSAWMQQNMFGGTQQ